MMKKLFYVSIAFLAGHLFLKAQTVTTFADGFPDDCITTDAAGNIYASGFTTGIIYRFTPEGVMDFFISGLNKPNGIDFDGNGNLYVSDWGDNLIYRFNPDGTEDASITIPLNPSGMIKDFDSNVDMIYTRYTGNSIHRITPLGNITTISSDPALNGPVGLAYNEDGDLFVGNYNNRAIYKVLENGSLQYIATVGSSSNLGFIAYSQGYLWGTVLGEHKIYRINPNGIDEVYLFAGSTAGNQDGDISQATFNAPNGIAFSEDGETMYVTDYNSKNLRIISGITLGNDEFQIKNEVFAIVPNPADEAIEILFSNSSLVRADIKIFDEVGKLVFENPKYEISEKINISSLKRGVYLVKVTTEEGILCKKLIK
ncbi:MAG: SMP-30/gluconolactonase/LRE family protein [Flavobacteriaceae bacterium]